MRRRYNSYRQARPCKLVGEMRHRNRDERRRASTPAKHSSQMASKRAGTSEATCGCGTQASERWARAPGQPGPLAGAVPSVLHVLCPRDQRELGALQLAAQVVCVLQVGAGLEAVVALQHLDRQRLCGAAAPGARGCTHCPRLARDDLARDGVAGQACMPGEPSSIGSAVGHGWSPGSRAGTVAACTAAAAAQPCPPFSLMMLV